MELITQFKGNKKTHQSMCFFYAPVYWVNDNVTLILVEGEVPLAAFKPTWVSAASFIEPVVSSQ